MSPIAALGTGLSVAVFGANGGIGRALIGILQAEDSVERVFALSRVRPDNLSGKTTSIAFDLLDEKSISDAAAVIAAQGPLHLVIIATGLLHDDSGGPEKRGQDLSEANMQRLFAINTIGPTLIAKHVLPILDRDRQSVFAALSARVGSISDNRLGGWHSYRASKAALNMMLRTLSVELAYRNPRAVCVALHPGTVDTPLSKPFQSSLSSTGIFSPHQAATNLLGIIAGLSAEDTGSFIAWDGQPISY